MSLLLCIETATTSCSVALGSGNKIISFREENAGYTHAEHLTIYIQEVMKQAGKHLKELDAIAVSMGPGSYTGLRIGVSTAKGLCYALDKPLVAVPTLMAMAASQRDAAGRSLLCPMIDARRMEVYCAIYDHELHEVKATAAEIITESSFSDLLSKQKIMFFGDGAVKCKDTLGRQPNAIFKEDVLPSARNLVPLAFQKFEQKQFEDLALFEPFYLKDFVAGGKQSGV